MASRRHTAVMTVYTVGYQQRTISCVRSKQLHEDVVPTTMCAGQIKPHVERKCNLTACERYDGLLHKSPVCGAC